MRACFVGLAWLALLAGCATPPPGPAAVLGLACTLPSNCVNSLGTGGLLPLAYAGTPAQAMARLQATLASFPEATVVRSEPLALEVIFITRLGFRDQVDFRIDPGSQRVEFRSRSLFGLFDFGKNRSRMQDFQARFEQPARRPADG
jgi:uncharacterized protein (DUF1499 family)